MGKKIFLKVIEIKRTQNIKNNICLNNSNEIFFKENGEKSN